MAGKYDDIIDLPRPVSLTRERMPMSARAAQFSPFAALSGHDAALRETARHTTRKIDLDEQTREDLERRLAWLHDNPGNRVDVTYFQPDHSKSGGSYLTKTSIVERIDTFRKMLILEGGISVSFADLLEISGLPPLEETS